MSNSFKTNSRFNMLVHDTSISKVMKKNKKNELDKKKVEEKSFRSDDINSFKRPSNDDNRNQRNSLTNRYNKEQIDRISMEDKKKREDKKKLDADKISHALSIENFPSLGKIHKDNTSTTVTNNTSFLAKLNTVIHDDTKYNDDLEPGWVSVTKDPLTGKTKMTHKPPYSPSLKQVKGEIEMACDVLYGLCNLHEERTTEYINLYGYDIWEKNFRYYDYDYDWVDKLDEEYELEMDKLYQRDKDDYISDQDLYY